MPSADEIGRQDKKPVNTARSNSTTSASRRDSGAIARSEASRTPVATATAVVRTPAREERVTRSNQQPTTLGTGGMKTMAKRSAAATAIAASPVQQDDADERHSGVQLAAPANLDAPEPSEAEIAEAGAELIRAAKTTDLTEGMLARYFRDMAIHTVMSPEEEVKAAKEFLDAEINRWRAVLAYPPALPIVTRIVDAGLVEAQVTHPLPEVEKLKKLLKEYRKNRSKLDSKSAKKWT